MNNADMKAKGRRFHRPNVKLTEAQVREIKYRLSLGVRLDRLARDFAVTPAAISSIRDGRTWVGVDP